MVKLICEQCAKENGLYRYGTNGVFFMKCNICGIKDICCKIAWVLPHHIPCMKCVKYGIHYMCLYWCNPTFPHTIKACMKWRGGVTEPVHPLAKAKNDYLLKSLEKLSKQ